MLGFRVCFFCKECRNWEDGRLRKTSRFDPLPGLLNIHWTFFLAGHELA
jgi:hypothetical protein